MQRLKVPALGRSAKGCQGSDRSGVASRGSNSGVDAAYQ